MKTPRQKSTQEEILKIRDLLSLFALSLKSLAEHPRFYPEVGLKPRLDSCGIIDVLYHGRRIGLLAPKSLTGRSGYSFIIPRAELFGIPADTWRDWGDVEPEERAVAEHLRWRIDWDRLCRIAPEPEPKPTQYSK